MLSSCDSMCMCATTDASRVDNSYDCRTQLQPGSHCALAKEVRPPYPRTSPASPAPPHPPRLTSHRLRLTPAPPHTASASYPPYFRLVL
eukprot:3347698-Prymnesium_polylepis.1